MKILVLGGGGFVGSHTVNKLLSDTAHEVWAYDRYDDKLDDSFGHPRLTFIQGDMRHDHERLERLVRDADLVIDLIAHANPSLYVTVPLEVYHLNFTENLVIAEYCIKHRKRLIQFSTCEVYGKTVVPLLDGDLAEPDDPKYAVFNEDTTPMILGPVGKHRWIYSCAKQLLERVLHAYGLEDRLNYTIIRPFNFIGPKIDYLPSEKDGIPRVFSNFLQSLLKGLPMTLVGGGEQRRAYTYIDDAVDCIMRIIDNPNGVCDKEIFNIGSPSNEVSIRELAIKMRDIYKSKWWDGMSPLSDIMEVSGEDFYGEGYDDSDRRIPDILKATTLLGWTPKYDLDSTIERSMAYWCERTNRNKPNGVATSEPQLS